MLNDLFSLMVHLKPAPVVARVATCMPKLGRRSRVAGARDRSDDVSGGAGRRLSASPGAAAWPPRARRFPYQLWTYVEPDPDRIPTTDDCSAML